MSLIIKNSEKRLKVLSWTKQINISLVENNQAVTEDEEVADSSKFQVHSSKFRPSSYKRINNSY